MHELRPTGEREAQLWDAAATVPDPEIPVISIADLGILRGVRWEGEQPIITITPTYSGCPAMDTIAADVKDAVEAAGFPRPSIDLVLHPAWSTDWMTEEGKQQLQDYGIAPPQRREASSGPIPLTLSAPVACPRCGSRNTQKLSHFGSTSCKALYSCRDCHEPFDYFKVH
ncbi:1,2-phenylacetyl-CoA epoxidase subunit PaaD [Corynebacterium epidermidicanis]|uniref:Phenylacetate-CoA oxygenase, PaaJ subunit n=1 Tax=Corynebacterium epidermidicanis TaxID=1050174 RepID=A0A0G3GT11_9CORY|nr:1,2-phenylacetyl-CoA epoxidase subunit PaaD [Corynebacterium epidermidicanis]AKK04264.1 phenylacetate-CoA oxygenase, PaaJ subunit [Corynebacterium epidermidicanis]